MAPVVVTSVFLAQLGVDEKVRGSNLKKCCPVQEAVVVDVYKLDSTYATGEGPELISIDLILES